MRRLILPALALAACTPGFASGLTGDWHLIGIEGQPAPAPLSISFAADGGFAGQAPCNRFFGQRKGNLPDLSLAPIGATRMACPDLAIESAYFEALEAMRRAEVDQGHLFLIGAEGRVLEFAPSAGDACLSCLAAN